MPFCQKLTQKLGAAITTVNRGTVGRLARVLPRTLRFCWAKPDLAPGLEAPAMSAKLAAGFALDEVVMAAFLGKRHFPDEPNSERVGHELRAAEALYGARGWLDAPLEYHRRPPALTDADTVVATGWTRGSFLGGGLAYRHVSWESGYEPYEDEPGRDRWLGYKANRRAAADLVIHPDGADRPWIICIHGYTMGYPLIDFQGLHAKRLHRELGFNLALPVLPVHGPRTATRISGEAFLSFDLMNSIHGFAQAIWDIRRLIAWIRSQGATRIGLYGISLGGYTAALLSGIEDDLEIVVSGVPVSDVRMIMLSHSPENVKAMAVAHGLGTNGAHKVVSPLAFAPKIDLERRFIFAGYGDRISSAGQAHALWRHWDEPEICWYPGGHLGYLAAPEVSVSLGRWFRETLLDDKPADKRAASPIRRTA